MNIEIIFTIFIVFFPPFVIAVPFPQIAEVIIVSGVILSGLNILIRLLTESIHILCRVRRESVFNSDIEW